MKHRKHFLLLLAVFSLSFLFSSAAMAADGWSESDGDWYYYENGSPYVNRWLQVYNQMPESPEDTDTAEFYWYYFDEKGKMVTSRWKTISEQKYRFDDEGIMQSGWYDDDYYLGGPDDGALKYGWQLIETDEPADDAFYENHPDDVSASGNQMLWYYFRTNGKAIKDDTANIYGRLYRFDSTGASDRFAYEGMYD